ncbi:alpha/beta fold hydrolase [Alicyclobacillus curvatus]|jgi:predicted dienelactone hydrolase|nr:alpha/beta fold hydrolase [Alicyclobacillus curvatus]
METNAQPVGRIVKVVRDVSRAEIYNTEEHRSFPVSIYYPSLTSRENVPASTILSLFHPATNQALDLFSDVGIEEDMLTSVKIPVVQNGHPKAVGPLPVVIFSPGFGIDRDLYVEVVTRVVQSGYVVVAVGAPYDSFLTVYPDGTVTAQANKHPSDNDQLEVRMKDIRLVMEQLDEWNEDSLRGLLAVDRIAMMGHSLGGAAAFNVAATDERVQCVVLLDASLHLIHHKVRNFSVLNIRQEAASYSDYFDVMRAEEDEETSERIARAYIENQTWLYNQLPETKSFVKIVGANHLSFSTISRLISSAEPKVMSAIQELICSFVDEFVQAKHGVYTKFMTGATRPSNVVAIDGAGIPMGT